MKQLSLALACTALLGACTKNKEMPMSAMERQIEGTWYKTKEVNHQLNWAGTGRDTALVYTTYTNASKLVFGTFAPKVNGTGKELTYTVGPWGDVGTTPTEETQGYWFYEDSVSRLSFNGYRVEILDLTTSDLTLRYADSEDTVTTYYHK